MIFAAPVSFTEAQQSADAKRILQTTGRTRDLQKMPGELKRRALWSATVQVVEPLQILSSGLSSMTAGNVDQATVRLAIKEVWQKLGYKPDPEQIGGILDLGSDARINLQIETNVATVRGAGWYQQGQNKAVLEEFPAWELYDTAPGGTGKRRVWPDRWAKVGGVFVDGRMIALVDDEVWDRLGDPDNFGDALGNRFAPFALNSAWRTRDVPRDEVISLGLMKPDQEVEPEPLDLTANLQAKPDVQDQELRRELLKTGLGTFDGDVFKFKRGGQS